MSDHWIQFLDNSGWRTCVNLGLNSSSGLIRHEMEQAQQRYPGHRIRCVDSEDRLIDIL